MKNKAFFSPMTGMVILFVICASVASCTTSFQDRQIKDIPGEWEVFQTTTEFADFQENSTNPIEPLIEESGDLGIFNFSRSTVNYSYLRNDSLYTGNGSYSIDRKRFSQKIIFASIENFLLLPPGDRVHSLIFNDSDNGVVMMLNFRPQETGLGEGYTLFLRRVD